MNISEVIVSPHDISVTWACLVDSEGNFIDVRDNTVTTTSHELKNVPR